MILKYLPFIVLFRLIRVLRIIDDFSGVVLRDAPPPDYYAMMQELHKIGNNLNQIAQKAHVLNVVDVQRYDQEVRKFNKAVREITEAVILPGKNKSWQ